MELEIQNIAFTQGAAAAEEGEYSDHDEDLCTESSWDPNEDDPEEIIPDLQEQQMKSGPQTRYRKKIKKTSKTVDTSNDSYGEDEDEEIKGLESESDFNEDAFQDNVSDDPDISN